jgi:hypothetical protein
MTANFVSVSDSYVNQNTPSNNMGTMAVMYVTSTKWGNADANTRALVRYDLSAIPQGAQVTSAYLKLRMDVAPAVSRTYQVQRVTEAWTETGVTWNNQPGTALTVTDSLSTGTTPGVWLTWNVTTDVQAMVAGTQTNHGWRVKDQSESASGGTYYGRFITREEAGVNVPVLVVTWSQ